MRLLTKVLRLVYHSFIDSTYPTAYFDDFYDLHDEKKMITLAELKKNLLP